MKNNNYGYKIFEKVTLKEYLKSINKSGYQLAIDAGIPKQTVGDLIKGATDIKNMKLINAIKLAAALHITVDELLMFRKESE